MSVKALVVGVSDYTSIGEQNLEFCKNDIDNASESLIKGLSVKPTNILKMGENRIVRIESIINALENFNSGDENEDTFIFYFSGHGGIDSDGKHILAFSDGYLKTENLIELMNNMNAKNKLIILDTCHSGHFEIDSLPEMRYESSINDFLGKGYAVLASSASDQFSYNYPEKKISLFTSFFSDAITARLLLKKGNKSLDDIKNLLFQYMKIWNKKNPEYAQNPIFRSKLGGTILFSVEQYMPYKSNNYYLDQDKYRIYQVDSIHTGSAKRYVVKVILKDLETLEGIAKAHKEIVNIVKDLGIYSNENTERHWKGKLTNNIFCHYGKNEDDIINSNFFCKTIWVDATQDKEWWYRSSEKSRVISDVYFEINPSYETLNEFYENHTSEVDVLIKQTKKIMTNMINLAEEMIKNFNELSNGSLTEKQFIEESERISPKITKLFFQEFNLDLSPKEIKEWSSACAALAGTIHDFTLFYGEHGLKNRTYDNRIKCMNITKSRYYEDLEKLREEEKKIDN